MSEGVDSVCYALTEEWATSFEIGEKVHPDRVDRRLWRGWAYQKLRKLEKRG